MMFDYTESQKKSDDKRQKDLEIETEIMAFKQMPHDS